MSADKNEKPLVSICLTFFSAEKFIHRVFDSCLNQTYKNIEVIVVDNASVDNTGSVIKEYAARDPRIKYFRNAEKIHLTECLRKMFELAQGRFVMMIGADDWLAQDFVENGMRSFTQHPDSAGIVPKVLNFNEIESDRFEFDCVTRLPAPGVYKPEWLVKRMYRGLQLYISAYALARREDMLSTIDFFIKNLCKNPLMPEDLRELFWGSYGTDPMFLEVLSRYKTFVYDDSLVFLKVGQPGNIVRDFKYNSVYEIFRSANYMMLSYSPLYEMKWPKFYRGLKIFSASEVLSTIFLNFFKYGMHPSFFDISKSRKKVSEFFSYFSFLEIVAGITGSVPRIAYRVFDAVRRKLSKTRKFSKGDRDVDMSMVWTQKNFLDKKGFFRVYQ
ncbi:MAG: glycosyltransferase family 2 protein [Candidatus Jorgensenbacteria bacterium]